MTNNDIIMIHITLIYLILLIKNNKSYLKKYFNSLKKNQETPLSYDILHYSY